MARQDHTSIESQSQISRVGTTDGQEIEYFFPSPDALCPDAGYLRIKRSTITGRYCTDILVVRAAFRRRGIGSALLEYAAAELGYTPDPEAILDNQTAPGFWAKRGFTTGFNQSILEA